MDRDRIIEIEHAWAAAEREIVEMVRRLDPSWGSVTFAVAGGWAVLAGSGLYTNCLLGGGLTVDVAPADLDQLEHHAKPVGVPAALQISEATTPGLEALVVERGYVIDAVAHAVLHDLRRVPRAAPSMSFELIDEARLGRWQAATAAGWGHDTPAARAASDVYSAAALAVDRPGLILARSATDGRVLGAATLRIGDGFATLGGMSTLPAERSTGVQAALISHRLGLARDAGCRYAVSVATAGSGSLRNLRRLGCEPSHTKTLWTKG